MAEESRGQRNQIVPTSARLEDHWRVGAASYLAAALSFE